MQRLCDLVAPQSFDCMLSISEVNLLEIKDMFVLLNSSAIKGVRIENIEDFKFTCIVL